MNLTDINLVLGFILFELNKIKYNSCKKILKFQVSLKHFLLNIDESTDLIYYYKFGISINLEVILLTILNIIFIRNHVILYPTNLLSVVLYGNNS